MTNMTLPEQFTVLALQKKTGLFNKKLLTWVNFYMSAAAVMELALREKIAIDDKGKITVRDHARILAEYFSDYEREDVKQRLQEFEEANNQIKIWHHHLKKAYYEIMAAAVAATASV